MKKRKLMRRIIVLLIIFTVVLVKQYLDSNKSNFNNSSNEHVSYALEEIPDYNGDPYVVLDNNNPNFSSELMNTNSFEEYSSLDDLGRCGQALANIGRDLMPTEKRGRIGQIKPTGWHTVRYDDLIEGKYLYNRCHLIGYQLTGENANPKNLITCTRSMNTVGMLEFENQVAEYIKKTNNHVLYRVVPIFDGDNLLAKGVTMEAYSVEDNGKGIKFKVFVYNVQNGIKIDYKTGNSELE